MLISCKSLNQGLEKEVKESKEKLRIAEARIACLEDQVKEGEQEKMDLAHNLAARHFDLDNLQKRVSRLEDIIDTTMTAIHDEQHV